MNYKTTTLPSFNFIGLPLRTSNETMQGISTHWQKFYLGKIMDKIPNKIDYDVLGLYTDYEGDHTKPFTLIIGCRTRSTDNVPEGLAARTIPSIKYAVFTAKGKMPECIMLAWQDVWKSDIERAYSFDFEVYGEKSNNPEDAEIEIYISVR
jgi:predicted transcriptional regulator YdeE